MSYTVAGNAGTISRFFRPSIFHFQRDRTMIFFPVILKTTFVVFSIIFNDCIKGTYFFIPPVKQRSAQLQSSNWNVTPYQRES